MSASVARPARRVLQLELNELSPTLMARFIDAGELPTFRKLRDESNVYVTTVEERYPYLEPWIQWITAHAGVAYTEHGISHLNEGHRLTAKNVWDVLSDAAYRVWVCGSMSVQYTPGLRGAVLPDPWTTKVPPTPRTLDPYFAFVQQNVLEHSNARARLSPRAYAAFLAFMARNGLTRETVAAIAAQLAFERATGRGRWRRAALLDRLQMDLFQSHFERETPAFSTFFSNSTAHLQHLYWRNLEPRIFTSKPSDAQQRDYEGAILFGYKAMDRLVARVLDFAGDDTVVVFATALSQVPCLTFEGVGGKSYYRPRDFPKLLHALGLPDGAKATPVMAHEFSIELASEAEARTAEARLATVEILGPRGMHVERRGATVFTACRVWTSVPDGTLVTIGDAGARTTLPFYELFYKVDGVKSGMHHPDGLLWIRTPDRRHRVHEAPVPLAALAPTTLSMFSVAAPGTMSAPPLAGYEKLIA